MHAYTTHVLFKAKFIPNEYKMPGTATASTDQDEKGDWMLYTGGYYTFTTLMKLDEAELTYKFKPAGTFIDFNGIDQRIQ